MKKILVPTDFSATAFKAARFAAHLAHQKNWQVELCHVYRPFFSGFQSERQNRLDEEQSREDAEGRMQAFVARLQSANFSVDLNWSCIAGNMAEVIIEKAVQLNAVLIVMGTTGATGIRYQLLGSNTYAVIRQAPVPVLSVPNNVKSFRLKKIGFPTNFHAAEIAALKDVVNLIGEDISLIPFHLYEKDRVAHLIRMNEWKSKVSTIVAHRRMQYKLWRMQGFASGIRRFIKKEKPDALAINRGYKSFFERLAGHDLVRLLAHQCPLPILFVHEA